MLSFRWLADMSKRHEVHLVSQCTAALRNLFFPSLLKVFKYAHFPFSSPAVPRNDLVYLKSITTLIQDAQGEVDTSKMQSASQR